MSQTRTIAEITLSHPKLVLTPTIAAVPAMVTELEYQAIIPPDGYYLFFKAYGGDFAAFDDAIEDDPTVDDPRVIIDESDFRVYRMRLVSSDGLVLPMAAELGMRVLRAKSGEGGWTATLEVPALETLYTFRRRCQEQDVGFTVERLYHATDTEGGSEFGLTPVQQKTLQTAYERGYFDAPRGTTVGELATVLNVSSSAVSGRLHRGLRSLVENTIVR